MYQDITEKSLKKVLFVICQYIFLVLLKDYQKKLKKVF